MVNIFTPGTNREPRQVVLPALRKMLVSSQISSKRCLGLYLKGLRFHPEILSLINIRLFMADGRFLQTFWVSVIQNNRMAPSMEGRTVSVPPLRQSYWAQAMKASANASPSWGSIRGIVMAHQGCSPSPASSRTGYYISKENQKWQDVIFLEGYTARG